MQEEHGLLVHLGEKGQVHTSTIACREDRRSGTSGRLNAVPVNSFFMLPGFYMSVIYLPCVSGLDKPSTCKFGDVDFNLYVCVTLFSISNS